MDKTAWENFLATNWNDKNAISYNAFYEICKQIGVCDSVKPVVDGYQYDNATNYTHNYQIVAEVENGKIKDIQVIFNNNSNQPVNYKVIETLNQQISFFKTTLPMLIKICENANNHEVSTFILPFLQDIFHDRFGVKTLESSEE